MLASLWIIYLIAYVIFTLPFAGFSLIYIGGMMLPGILYTGWMMFEAMQSGGEFSVYYKVMGRWYFQLWAYLALPCAILANMGDPMLFVAFLTMLILPTIIWFFMYFWMNIGTVLTDMNAYNIFRECKRDPWTTHHELNWDDPLRTDEDD